MALASGTKIDANQSEMKLPLEKNVYFPVKLTVWVAFLLLLCDPCKVGGIAAQATIDTRPTTLVGSLVRPFDGCLKETERDIDINCLVDACSKLRDVMFQMGETGNARDLDSNLRKVEEARKKAPAKYQESLRALLEYEKEQGVKLPGGRLKNPSAAVGLLWMRRSVAFQRRMNSILLDQPNLPPTQAALEAYHYELEPYHSFGLRNIYRMAFRSTTPPRHKILRRFKGEASSMDTHEESLTINDLRQLLDVWQPVRSITSLYFALHYCGCYWIGADLPLLSVFRSPASFAMETNL